MSHLLMFNKPKILELEEIWVDKLLEVEKDIKGHDNINCLMCLL